MPPPSGRILKKKAKSSTPHQKNHRWESFTSKISKLHSLDPIKKVRRYDLDADDNAAEVSYFSTALHKWSEMNISRSFVSFRREAMPLCETLVQILHFEDRIFGLLSRHISANDKGSLEPLLDLLTSFAHDLGVRFEKYYAQSLALIVGVASQPQDVDVIEWTFGALAFLFKYLSKLIVPDMRPTYDVLSPLLGKTKVSPHIARFAAEALSFLVKKAASPSTRESSLQKLAQHVQKDLYAQRGERQFLLFKDGLMTIFAEACKGNSETVHSNGSAVITSLLRSIPHDEFALIEECIWTDVACGVTTSIIHHSNAAAMAETVTAICEYGNAQIENQKPASVPWRLLPIIRVYGTLMSVRKGSRISDWAPLVKSMIQALETISKTSPTIAISEDEHAPFWNYVMFNIALMWQLAPIDSLITSITPFTNILNRDPFTRWYIQFCSLFAELDSVRFKSLFLNHFQSFIATCYSDLDNEELLCILLPRLHELNVISFPADKEGFSIPQGWQAQIVNKFEKLEIYPFPERGAYDKDPRTWRDKCLPKYASLLHVLESCNVHPSTNARIAELMLRKLKLSLRPTTTLESDEVHFIVSRGFHAYLRMVRGAGSVDSSLQPLLRAALPRFGRSIGFLESMLSYEQHLAAQEPSPEKIERASESPIDVETAVMPLVANLASPSHELRYNSLLLLRVMFKVQGQEIHECVDTMVGIEHTPLELANTRHIGMLMRKLGISFASIEAPWLQKAVASFLFGMLAVKLAPVWDYAIEAIQKVAESKVGEEHVSALAFDWLTVPSPRWTGCATQTTEYGRRYMTDFECTNVDKTRVVSTKVFETVSDAVGKLLAAFDEKQSIVEDYCDQARGRALKAFAAVPLIAESKSRLFIPHFLSWSVNDEEAAKNMSQETDHQVQKSWSLSDRKAMLKVIEQFINPCVLFQHKKVYDALLSLLENGDVDIQRLALKGILTWKQDGVKPYAERLETLLDDSKFKNELTLMFQGEQEIQPGHRAELMPVLLRLLYGRTISKKGIASGRHGLQATRLAVLRNLSVTDLGAFIEISLGALRGVKILDGNGQLKTEIVDQEIIPVRQMFGFLNMASSLTSELGSSVLPYTETLANSVLYCLFFCVRRLRGIAEEDQDVEELEEQASNNSLLRSARTAGLKCLNLLFRNASMFEWTAYAAPMVAELITPRLEKLPIESAQGVSNVLQLVATWSTLPKAAMFMAIDALLLPKMMAILAVEKAKDDVKVFSLRVVRNLVKIVELSAAESEFNELVRTELLETNMNCILEHITIVLEAAASSHELLEACVDTIVEISPYVDARQNVRSVLDISTRLLGQPPRKVNPRTKGKILLVLEKFVAIEGPRLVDSSELSIKIRDALASLFSYFKDHENRDSLCRVLAVLAKHDKSLAESSHLCTELNAYADGLSDEPAYDRRLAAYNAIYSARCVPMTPQQWLPILHNLVFFLKFDEEYGILSSNSADGLRRFVEDVAGVKDPETRLAYEAELGDIVLPAMYSGAREPAETVRRECLRVMGHMLVHIPEWGPISDMEGLRTMEEDASEPVFFFNILSPSTAKQLEAFEILRAANAECEISSANISMFFIPLLEHFIFGRSEGLDPAMGSNATTVLSDLALSLEFRHYRSILLRYIGYIESKPDFQKQNIRLMGRFANSLMVAWKQRLAVSVVSESDVNSAADTDVVLEMETDRTSETKTEAETQKAHTQRLQLTIPEQEKLNGDIINNFLPPMMKHLHEKDESEVSYRVPVGVIVVRLLVILPESEMSSRLAAVLTDICHILRSKAWESREMARDTLVKIAVVLGAKYFGFILNELKGALQRGYQLHVLSYTMHSLLLATIPEFGQGSLDYCLSTMVTIIMDDIFGVIGQEKDADGYTTTMKEIKSSKSQDSMELISKSASITHLSDLVAPMQQMLLQKVDLKIVRKIDALLARISAGLIQNPAAESRDSLIFCYEVIKEVYGSQKAKKQPKIDPKLRRYLIVKGAKKSDRAATSRHTYKLTRFAIDLLRAVTKRFDSLRNSTNLVGFIPILGDSIVDGEEEVKIAVFKLLVTISKVPFSTPNAAGVYKVAVKEAAKTISQSHSTTTDAAQAALKFLSIVLRDRPDIEVRPAAIDVLAEKLKDDLTNTLYRHVTFNFLRAVLDRKIETAAVYDTLDYVGTIMIANEDKDTRDLARGAFFQFLRDYPQKKARWTKQMNFIVSNLQYEREGGRISVMEIMHLLLQKSADDFVQEVAGTCFLPLVMVVANDDSEKCRLAAVELVKQIFRRANTEGTSAFLRLIRNWASSVENRSVFSLALKTMGLYFDAAPTASENKKDLKLVLKLIVDNLPSDATSEASDADLPNVVIDVVRILTTRIPQTLLSPACASLWDGISRWMVHPEHSVKLNATRLISTYLIDFAENRRADSDVLNGSYGLQLGKEDIEQFARLAMRILTTREMEEELASEAGQMLIFLGQHLAQVDGAHTRAEEEEGYEGRGGAEEKGDAAEQIEEDIDTAEPEPETEPEPTVTAAQLEEEPEDENDSLDTKSFNLLFLFKKLSFVLRRGTAPRPLAMYPKVAAMEVLETLCRRVAPAALPEYLKTVMLPLHHLTDPNIAAPFSIDEVFKAKHEGVRTRAQILMDLLKKRVGISEYTRTLLEVRAEVRARRLQRQAKRKIEAVSMPEKHGRDKRKKFERKKVKRQQRGQDHKTMRQSYKGW
ncbi:U3 snoRNP protein [Ceratocystis pirilliformis]|uniref:U3 snoRNP protein n=1 Tax=Ceratocystis pirilliformis TaxID=259994 RepID=A0ABR3YTI8_9PEZI